MSTVIAAKPVAAADCPVVELRQYTLHPGARNTLIELFEREFIESQEAVGMSIIGQFRDLDNPDRFVWLRGFADMPSRAQALAAFYGGPVWKAHRDVANATMVDSDNVLLLKPLAVTDDYVTDDGHPDMVDHLLHSHSNTSEELVVITLWYGSAPAATGFAEFFADRLAPLLAECGGPIVASFVTEYSTNTFPALPVREGEHILASVACFAGHAAYARHVAALTHSSAWRVAQADALAHYLVRSPETLRLAPTQRSLLRGLQEEAQMLPLSIGDTA